MILIEKSDLDSGKLLAYDSPDTTYHAELLLGPGNHVYLLLQARVDQTVVKSCYSPLAHSPKTMAALKKYGGITKFLRHYREQQEVEYKEVIQQIESPQFRRWCEEEKI